MVKAVGKKIFLRSTDGTVSPFDAGVLKSRLEEAFQNAGQQEESFLSGELVLALEYSLLTTPKEEPVFNVSEVDTALIRLLESFGFPEVAHFFRNYGNESSLQISVDPEAVENLCLAYLGCTAVRAGAVAEKVSADLKKLGISETSVHLILELSRHREREFAEKDFQQNQSDIVRQLQISLSDKDIYDLMDRSCRELSDAGILLVRGISTLFPSIRFEFFMEPFAIRSGLTAPVTELELYPLLYEVGKVMENIRKKIIAALPDNEDLPCCLALSDVALFQQKYAGCPANDKLAKEYASELTAALDCPLYQLVIGK